MVDLALLVAVLGYFAASAYLVVRRFRLGMVFIGLASVAILVAMAVVFLAYAWPAWTRYGASLVASAEWDPVRERYGLLHAVAGTLITSGLAILIAMPLAISVAVAVNELLPARLRGLVGSLVDLAAAMPTVVYGLWGLFVLGPWLSGAVEGLARVFGMRVEVPPYTLLTASVLLAIMITPYAAAIIREGYALVPRHVEEAIYAVGAMRFEAILLKLRYARAYVVGGLFLALGRAMGETVAVAMVVGGNVSGLVLSPLEPGITISSLIALQFPNAVAYRYMEAVLYAAALVLAAMGVALNAAVLAILRRWQV